jgi:Spy/CpxP family protein refolding chaperone
MTVRKNLLAVLSSLVMVFAVASFAMAQETAPAPKTDDSVKQEGPRGPRGPRDGKGFGRHGGGEGVKGRHGMRGEKGFGGHRGGGMRGGFHMLNLSEDQKQKLKGLHESFRTSNEASFKEVHSLRLQKRDKTITAEGEARLQELKKQMKTAHEGLRASAEGILTAEQKTQLETMKAERKQKMEERRKMWEQKKAAKPAETKQN